jgi:putative ABC transport system permease protein
VPILRLILSNLARRPARLWLTAAAIALSVSLVVSTTSGYASAEAAVRAFIEQYLGSDDLRVEANGDATGLTPDLLESLRADPAVYRAAGRLTDQRRMIGPDGDSPQLQFNVLGIDPTRDGYLARLPLDSGRKPDEADTAVALLDLRGRDELGASIGDTIAIPRADGEAVELEVIGFIYKPGILYNFVPPTAYVPLETLGEATAGDGRPADRLTAILIELEVGTDIEAFATSLEQEIAQQGKTWSVSRVRADREAIDRGLRGMTLLSLMGGIVSLTAATFIVFGTMSMGVAERQRTLAMLRAVGATRSQVALTVIGEGIVLAGVGIVIGVPLGLLFVLGLTWWYAEVFAAGLAIGWLGLASACVGMLLAAVIASAFPAYTASRVDPLAAMRPDASAPPSGPPWKVALAGLVLMAIDVLLLWPAIGVTPLPEQLERDVRFWLHFFIGLPTLWIGLFLIAPMLIWLIERAATVPVAGLMRIRPSLLRQQLSSGLWRAAGTGAALMVGPAVLIVMNTQGRSGIEGWQLPDRFPDVFFFDVNGLTPQAVDTIATTDGIRVLPDGTPDVSPIGYLHPRLGDSVFAITGAAYVPDSTMLIAVDPGRIFEMMDLDFLDGDATSAARFMQEGIRATLDDQTVADGIVEEREGGDVLVTLAGDIIDGERVVSTQPRPFLVVTAEFQELQDVGVGDPFVLLRPRAFSVLGRLDGEPVEFTVAGVVRSPGIDLMVSSFDLGRQFQARSAASVFGTIDDARDLFGMQDVFLVAANLELGVEKDALLGRIEENLGGTGIGISDVRQLKFELQQGLRRLLLVATSVAWAALVVASLGVTNAVMAGVRSRRYQLGVLRAVGLTRGELLRLILAESLLLAAVATVLGITAGLLMALNARQLQQWTIGYVPPLRIPWDVITIGIVAVFVVALLASLWPAVGTARTQVLRLLQSGRGAA